MTSLRAKREGRARALAVVVFTGFGLVVAIAPTSWASSLIGNDDPTGRGLQLLQARESALGSQAAQAIETARRRGRMLYRLLLHETAERRSGIQSRSSPPPSSTGDAPVPGGRAIALGVAVLARDLDEAAVLRDELDRVRAERRAAVAAADARAAGDVSASAKASPKLRAPVAGPIIAPWGVVRDEATGAWLFRTAAGYAPAPGAPVVAPADGHVARVVTDVGGGRALVLVHAGGLTTVLGGLATVAVVSGELVRAGAVIGTAGRVVRVEASRGRTPVDPAALFTASGHVR